MGEVEQRREQLPEDRKVIMYCYQQHTEILSRLKRLLLVVAPLRLCAFAPTVGALGEKNIDVVGRTLITMEFRRRYAIDGPENPATIFGIPP